MQYVRLLLVLFLFQCNVFASEWLFEINPNARVKALGGAGVALNDSSSSLYINPGSMAYDPYGRLSLFYGNLSEGSHFSYMEYVYPFRRMGSLGVSVEARIKDNSNHIQYYSFGFSTKVFKGFFMGITAKAMAKTFEGEYTGGYGIDSGIHIAPFKWLNVGIKGENLIAPEKSSTRNIHYGFSIFHKRYFNLVTDIYAEDIEEKFSDMKITNVYGIELYPDPAFAIRGGIKDDHWCLGLGIISKNINFDYALVTEYDDIVHFFQCVYKFGLTLTRKEEELIRKDENIRKETLYFEGLKCLNMGEVAAAKEKVNEYIKKYGTDEKIESLNQDIENWLNKVREEKLGSAEELKKEILMDYYQGRLEQALIKHQNLKLLAPNYEEVYYLECILNAGVFLEQGKYMEAEEELIKALKVNPDSKEVEGLYNRLKEVIKLNE